MTNRWRRALAAPSGLFLLAVLAAGLAAPLLPLADPTAIDISSKFLPPSLEHPFGTDLLGRDIENHVVCVRHSVLLTSKASRSASPRKLSAATTSRIARPGTNICPG